MIRHSVQVLLPLILGAILASLFVYWQYMMALGRHIARVFPLQRPTIPWHLIATRNIGLLFYINFATGMGKLQPARS